MKKKLIKPNIIPQQGKVQLCGYCGEQIGNSKKFCVICKTKAGRESILEANKLILTELRKKGYCQKEVALLKA